VALFGRKPEDNQQSPQAASSGMQAAPAKRAFCRLCGDHQMFSKCWMHMGQLKTCGCCNTPFEDAAKLYGKNLPACPRCGEYLEQPGFVYGVCDGCGSKFELMDGAVPSLIPNLQQRRDMRKFGKAWSPD